MGKGTMAKFTCICMALLNTILSAYWKYKNEVKISFSYFLLLTSYIILLALSACAVHADRSEKFTLSCLPVRLPERVRSQTGCTQTGVFYQSEASPRLDI